MYDEAVKITEATSPICPLYFCGHEYFARQPLAKFRDLASAVSSANETCLRPSQVQEKAKQFAFSCTCDPNGMRSQLFVRYPLTKAATPTRDLVC